MSDLLGCLIDANLVAMSVVLTNTLSAKEMTELIEVIEGRLKAQGFTGETIDRALESYRIIEKHLAEKESK